MRRQGAQVVDPMVGDDVAAQGPQLRHEGVRHGLRSAADHRPADRVGEGAESQTERRGERAVQPQHRVGGDPREEGPCRLVLEAATGQSLRRTECRESEARHRHAAGAGRG